MPSNKLKGASKLSRLKSCLKPSSKPCSLLKEASKILSSESFSEHSGITLWKCLDLRFNSLSDGNNTKSGNDPVSWLLDKSRYSRLEICLKLSWKMPFSKLSCSHNSLKDGSMNQ